jgi:hypothetical protein
MTPTPQKSIRPEYNSQRCKYCREFHGFKDEDICLAISTIEAERTAYNALLDKVQLIETERDELKAEVARLNCIHSVMEDIRSGVKKGTLTIDREAFMVLYDKEIGELKKHVDSEYDRGIEDAAKVADGSLLSEENPMYKASEAILKLRRVS